MNPLDNWGKDVLKFPTIKWVDGSLPDFGIMLTDTFEQFAEQAGISCLFITWPANRPEEYNVNQVNSSKKNAKKVLRTILKNS